MRSQVWKQLVGKNIHGKICHQLVVKESSIFNAQRSTSSQILYCVLGGSIRIRNLTKHGRKGQNGFLLKATETLTESMESRRNSNGTSSQVDTLQLCHKVKNTRTFQKKNSVYVNLQRHFLWNKRAQRRSQKFTFEIKWDTRESKRQRNRMLANARLVLLCARRFGKRQWSFIDPRSEKKGYSVKENSHKESGTKLQKRCCWNSQRKWLSNFLRHESIVQRLTRKQRTW